VNAPGALLCVIAAALLRPAAPDQRWVVWPLDNIDRVGGHVTTVAGSPRVVKTDIGPAVEFNGRTDGLFVEANPLRGLACFTIEVVFQPDDDGPEEQRFVHVEETGTGNRALVELRMLSGARWSLDTYLRSGGAALTLFDRSRTHPAARWHVAALTYDGRTMMQAVDGACELTGEIAFTPLGEGRTSIGVRQNRVSWFKGRIHRLRFAPGVRDAGRSCAKERDG
jgi:hypothetical protein